MSQAAALLERFTNDYLERTKDGVVPPNMLEGMEFSITDEGILSIRDVESTRSLRIRVDLCCFEHFVYSFSKGLQKAIILGGALGKKHIDLVDGGYTVHLIGIRLPGGEDE